MRVRRARPDEGERLREIAAAAKGSWGYDRAQVDSWAVGLDLAPRALAAKEFYVGEVGGRVTAFASVRRDGDVCVLDDLWVDPDASGRGIGRRLFAHALERARELGAVRLEWEAEPNAVGFYENLGGRRIRESEPTSWGRRLPVMAIDVG